MSKHGWISLSDFFFSMRHDDSPYRWLFNHEQQIKNMLIHGTVPTRGMAAGQHVYQRIETYFTQDAEVGIFGNRVTVVIEKIAAQPPFIFPLARQMTCECVQVARVEAEAWLNENALESGELPESSDGGPTRAAETKMERWFQSQPQEPVRRKEDVWKRRELDGVLGDFGKRLSRKAFIRAWRSFAPAEWKHSGSKKNCPHFPPGG
jgi:hypothetical protein